MGVSAVFSGNSRFAVDFQSVIQRSVAIASLPLQQLNSVRSELTAQSSALSALGDRFAALQSALSTLAEASSLGSYSATVSEPSVLHAVVSAGVRAASYTVEVVSPGSRTSAMSADGLDSVSDPATQSISSAGAYTLTINGTSLEVTPAFPTLNALVDALNALPGTPVHSSIVNVGSTSAPDYRLAVQSARYGADTIELTAGGAPILNTLATGSAVSYKVNGLATPIENDSREVILAPGLTLHIQKASVGPVTVSVSRTASELRGALLSFIDAYNACVGGLDSQRGKGAGALSGQGIVIALGAALRQLASHSAAGGPVRSIAELGLSFDTLGRLSLDNRIFNSVSEGSLDGVFAFLGTPDESGFLGAASAVLKGIAAEPDGILNGALDTVSAEIASQDRRIAENQERIAQLRQRLEEQMAAADALIASLEQQVAYFDGLFEAMRISSRNQR